MPQSKYTRKRAFMPFEKCVEIINDSQHDLKIRYTIQKIKSNANKIIKTTKKTHTFRWICGGWETETTDFYETTLVPIKDSLRRQKHKKIFLTSRKDTVRIEILNENDYCFKESVLEIGDTWTIAEVLEEELQKINVSIEKIQSHTANDQNKNIWGCILN